MKRFLLLFTIVAVCKATIAQKIVPNSVSIAPVPVRSPAALPGAFDANIKINYVRDWRPKAPINIESSIASKSVQDVQENTIYLDGLGRVIENVGKQASPLKKDLVTVSQYDNLGRETLRYLPYTDTGSSGLFKLNPFNNQREYFSTLSRNNGQYTGELFYYNETEYETSPVNRVIKTMAPGNSWVGSSRGTENKYLLNTEIDSVRLWRFATSTDLIPVTTSLYENFQLYKAVTISENGKQVIEYKDKEGKVILKKVQLSDQPSDGHAGWLCTYYVYDNLNLLRLVLQPKAVEYLVGSNWLITQRILDELCFQYQYDERARLVVKKVPGAGEMWLVYDGRDRLIMTQDANMRYKYWLITVYDRQNRPVKTGLWRDLVGRGRSEHSALAKSNSVSYPDISKNFETLTETFYDDYRWVSSNIGVKSSRIATWDNQFLAASSTIWPYAQGILSSNNTIGMVTGTKAKVLSVDDDFDSPSSWQYLYESKFYDRKGRVVQTQTTNITGGVDINTLQYSWSGALLRTYLKHEKRGFNSQTHYVQTMLSYDHSFRLRSTTKNVDNKYNQILNQLDYDELGQLKSRKVGGTSSVPLETLNSTYNIRGWLLGINDKYVNSASNTFISGDPYFGMTLRYDYGFTKAEYGGNISGTQWRTKGGGEKRAYGFEYDNTNRLAKADFTQNNGNTWNNVNFGNNTIDFSVSGGNQSDIQYDANGNILTMWQKGLSINTSMYIDQCIYTYRLQSNKLDNIYDLAYSPNTTEDTKGISNYPQYAFDHNGNMVMDQSKGIGYKYPNGIDPNEYLRGISNPMTYNFLNLPARIRIGPFLMDYQLLSDIEFRYDANGLKLEKSVIGYENSYYQTEAKTTKTLYINGFEYINDTLVQMGHEEGRIRWAKQYYLKGSSKDTMFYDFFVKDHLGNIRVVLTQQKDTAYYKTGMEPSLVQFESQLFNNLTSTRDLLPQAVRTSTNTYAAKLRGDIPGRQIGPSKILKVMAGDKVDINCFYYYTTTPSSTNNTHELVNSLAQDILTGFFGASSVTTASTKFTPSQNGDATFGNNSLFRDWLTNNATSSSTNQSNKPKAYLSYVLFDDQFKLVQSFSTAKQVNVQNSYTNSGTSVSGITIPRNGYLYVYTSNEASLDVFFDSLQIKHYTGPLLEETHYYPFGLKMEGISSVALGKVQSNYKYNGKEIQSDRLGIPGYYQQSGIQLYDYGARMYDPQTGRFTSIDPHADLYLNTTPYAYVLNNPVEATDPTGKDTHLEGEAAQQFFRALQNDPDDDFRNDINWTDKLAQGAISLNGGESDKNFVISAVLPVYQSITPETYAHIRDAQAEGYPVILTVNEPGFNDSKRRAAMRGHGYLVSNLLIFRDEYPFAGTLEGGLGASVRSVAAWEQSLQGSQISAIHAYLGPGKKYFVLTISSKTYSKTVAPAYYGLTSNGNLEPSKQLVKRGESTLTQQVELPFQLVYDLIQIFKAVERTMDPVKVPMIDPRLWMPPGRAKPVFETF